LRVPEKIATGSEDMQIPFFPTGSRDILEIARRTPLAGHLQASELRLVFGMVTHAGAELWDLAPTMDSTPVPVRI
jgi:cytosine deaminase